MARLNKWQLELQRLNVKQNDKIAKELRKMYVEALREVQAKLKDYYAEVGALGDKVPYWQHLRLGKYKQLEQQLVDLLNASGDKINHKVLDFIDAKFEQGYNELFYQIEQTKGVSVTFNQLNTNYIRSLTLEPVEGLRLDKLLWGNTEQVAKKATKILRNGLTQGVSYSDLAKQLATATDSDYKQCMRLVRTEGGRAYSNGKLEGYKETKKLGIEVKKMWVAALDSRTRSSHQHLDGKIVEADQEFVSKDGYKAKAPCLFHVAKEDINCRCAIVDVIGDLPPTIRRAKGTEKPIQYKNYLEWEKSKNEKSE